MYSAALLSWSPRVVPLPLLQLFFIAPTAEGLKFQFSAAVFPQQSGTSIPSSQFLSSYFLPMKMMAY